MQISVKNFAPSRLDANIREDVHLRGWMQIFVKTVVPSRLYANIREDFCGFEARCKYS